MPISHSHHSRGRLRHDGKIIGYILKSKDQTLFSRDQTHWSTTPLPSDQIEMSLGVNDASGRLLFWGDIVQAQFGPLSKPSYLLIIGSRNTPNVVADLKTGRLWSLDDHPTGITLTSTKWVEDIGGWNLSTEQVSKLECLVPLEVAAPRFAAFKASMCLMLGLGLTSSLQVVWQGSVGPVMACIGGGVGLAAYWWISQHKAAWMSRKHLIELSFKIALINSVVTLCFGLGYLDHNHSLKVYLVYLLVGFFLGGTAATITGDLVMWMRGGYLSELPKGKWNRRYPHR